MDRRSSLLALCPLAAVCIAFSANGFTVWQNRSVFFAATELVSNGVPGLTNMGSRLTVSAVPPVSAQGGRVTVINTQGWARFYQGPGHYDQAIGIVTDRSNNVCITGYSLGAGTSFDFATIMYAPDGTPLWTNRYDGPAGDCDFARYLAVDGLGNIYVTGESVGAEGATDVATIKYSANGLPAWTNRYNFSGTNIHYIAGLAADGVGNVYVGVGAISSQQMFITLRYDPLGRAVWTNHYRGSECGVDYPAALAVDRFGNVFVTGGSDTSTGQGFATLKYAADGRGLWTNLFTRSPGILPRDLAVDQTGNVIVAGENGIGGGITHVYATVKYANNGTAIWTNVWTGPQYGGGGFPHLAADASGNVFVLGGSPGAGVAEADITTVKISANGVPLWTNRFFDNNSGFSPPGAPAVDSAGNFYIPCHSNGEGQTNPDILLLKYAADGTPVWTNRFNGPADDKDFAATVAIDRTGSPYVTGYTDDPRRSARRFQLRLGEIR